MLYIILICCTSLYFIWFTICLLFCEFCFFICSILPTEALDVLSDFLGVNRTMDTFVGNQKNNTQF